MSISVETWRWLASDEGLGAIACAPAGVSAAAVAKLRTRYDAERARGVLEAGAARRKAAAKLDPVWVRGLLADVAGVEMASSARSSAHKAARYMRVLGEGACVADLCCGIGADSWGLSRAGMGVVGVDCDASRTLMYAHNLPRCSVVRGDALRDCPAGVDAFHLDPARRDAEGRVRGVDGFLPGPDVWAGVIGRVGSGAIKLNPGVDASVLPAGELEILSEPDGLTQAVLWVGALGGGCSRRATLLGADGVACSISGEPDRPEDSSDIGAFIGTIDPCVERADLAGVLLDQLGVRLVHPGTGLLTGESVAQHPMVRWYRVLGVMAWSEKRVRSLLRELGAGVVEIRTRGGVVNPDALQRRLRGDGGRDGLSVLVYRLGRRVVAVVAEGAGVVSPGAA